MSMKVTCDRKALLCAFQTAASVVPSRSPKPVLRNVKFEVGAERAALMATDLEIGVRVDLAELTVDTPGEVLLPIDRFGLILRESSDDRIAVEEDDLRVTVRSGQSKWRFSTDDPGEYPEVAAFNDWKWHVMSARLFRELVKRTLYAASLPGERYALDGVLIELHDNQIIGVATDGRRLACQRWPAVSVDGHATTEDTIVPSRAMRLIERALADDDGDIQLAVRDNDVFVRGSRVTLCARLPNGRYPKWRGVFPKQAHAVKIELTAGPFLAAVRQAAIVTSVDCRGVGFTFGGGKVVLATRVAEMGEAYVELPVAYDGVEVCVTLDPQFVGDFLRVLDPDQRVTVQVKDADHAVVCETDDGYSCVIMPVVQDVVDRTWRASVSGPRVPEGVCAVDGPTKDVDQGR